MQPLFTAREPFGPQYGETWDRYMQWAKIRQLTRLISMDGSLNAPVAPTMLEADWAYMVEHNDLNLFLFRNLDHLRARVPAGAPHHLLCVFANPTSMPTLPDGVQGRFLGCDLTERGGATSSLTNCGGFPDVFANAELSSDGLLMSLERALEVRRDLVAAEPDNVHADCDVWAMFLVED